MVIKALEIHEEHVSILEEANVAYVASQTKFSTIWVVTSPNSDQAHCNCPLGMQGNMCKHDVKMFRMINTCVSWFDIIRHACLGMWVDMYSNSEVFASSHCICLVATVSMTYWSLLCKFRVATKIPYSQIVFLISIHCIHWISVMSYIMKPKIWFIWLVACSEIVSLSWIHCILWCNVISLALKSKI